VARYRELLTSPILIADGHACPPAGPGWGAELREDMLSQYPPVDFKQVESEPYGTF